MSNKQQQNKIKDHLRNRFHLPEEQIEEMIPVFMRTLAEHMTNLEGAIAGGELAEIGKAAHTIKGALLNLGLDGSAKVALDIETGGRAMDSSKDYGVLAAQIRAELKPLFI